MVLRNVLFKSKPSQVTLFFFLLFSWLFNCPVVTLHLSSRLFIFKQYFMHKLVADADGKERSVRKVGRIASCPVKFSYLLYDLGFGIGFQKAVAKKDFSGWSIKWKKTYRLNSILKLMSAVVFSELQTGEIGSVPWQSWIKDSFGHLSLSCFESCKYHLLCHWVKLKKRKLMYFSKQEGV